MNIKFSDVLDLFELVNFGSPFDQEGYICKESGKTYFCRCGTSNNKPFCDGSHNQIDFKD